MGGFIAIIVLVVIVVIMIPVIISRFLTQVPAGHHPARLALRRQPEDLQRPWQGHRGPAVDDRDHDPLQGDQH